MGGEGGFCYSCHNVKRKICKNIFFIFLLIFKIENDPTKLSLISLLYHLYFKSGKCQNVLSTQSLCGYSIRIAIKFLLF